MQDVARAQRYINLGNDPVYQELIEDIRQEQASTFLKPSAKAEEIEEAHAIVRALDKLEGRIRSAKNSLTVANHKKE
jgi:chloramphenicol 3-O-phosphotransferase